MTTYDDKELIEIARKIVNDNEIDDDYLLGAAIIEALKQIRDARLKGPSRDEAVGASEYYDKFLSDTPVFENARTRWMKFDFISGANWLRSQLHLKPDVSIKSQNIDTLSGRVDSVDMKPAPDVTTHPQKHHKPAQDVTIRMPTSIDALNEAQNQFLELQKLEVLRDQKDTAVFTMAFVRSYDWLRSQIKAVQPISDEEFEKLVENSSDWDFEKDAIKKGWRACEARILGATK